jgi:ubiquinone/menaquinone biosynthesis C-methylase UbiE
VAYFFCIENGICITGLQRPSIEEKNDLCLKGIISGDHKLLDKEFGYTCYEYYRQIYAPDYFDTLLMEESKDRKKMLDLCCGGGATINALLKSKLELIYGIDSNENQIRLLRSMLQKSKSIDCEVIVKAADAHQLPLESHAVDFVVCRVALQYLNVECAIEEMNRVLSPQGKVFLLVHGSGYILDYFFSRKGIFRKKNIEYAIHKLFKSSHSNPGFYQSQARFLTIYNLKTKLMAAGFKEVKVYTSKKWLKFGLFPVYFAVVAKKIS